MTVWLGGHLTHSVLFAKCRPSLASPGSAWLEGSVGMHLNLHVPLDLGIIRGGRMHGNDRRHKHVLSAVALDDRGGVLGNWNGAMSAKSLHKLLSWAAELTPDATWATWAIEGSNNLGRRLALALTTAGADGRDVPTTTKP